MINLIKGECIEQMKLIPSGSIDAIITDPPYGTTACKWDSVIPFEPMWEQLNRIIKPNGAIVLFGSEPFSSALRMSNINNYKYDWIWEKHHKTGHFNAKNRPMKIVEDVIVFSERKHNYYPQGLIEINKPMKNSTSDMKRNGKNSTSVVNNAPPTKDYLQKYTNYPTEILRFKSMNSNGIHPTQKPVELMEYLIKTYTNEGETVLDFTMGSGSTGVAAKNLNRNFIGIELDEKYFNIAENRINEI